MTAVKVYYPEEGQFQVHQSRVCLCPSGSPPGYFWYGSRRHSSGRLPKWIQQLAQKSPMENVATSEEPPDQDFTAEPPEDTNGTEDFDWNREPDSSSGKTTQSSYRLDQNQEPRKKSITVEHNSQRSSQRYSLHPRSKEQIFCVTLGTSFFVRE